VSANYRLPGISVTDTPGSRTKRWRTASGPSVVTRMMISFPSSATCHSSSILMPSGEAVRNTIRSGVETTTSLERSVGLRLYSRRVMCCPPESEVILQTVNMPATSSARTISRPGALEPAKSLFSAFRTQMPLNLEAPYPGHRDRTNRVTRRPSDASGRPTDQNGRARYDGDSRPYRVGISVAGITRHPTEAWMTQMARNVSAPIGRPPCCGIDHLQTSAVAYLHVRLEILSRTGQVNNRFSENVKVTVQEGMLTIQGERKQEKEEKGKRKCCNYGQRGGLVLGGTNWD